VAEQDWGTNKRAFAAVSLPTLFWVVAFFLVPMAIVWLYSFGENRGLTDIDISGTLDNYKRATEWLYVTIFAKSFAVAALVTFLRTEDGALLFHMIMGGLIVAQIAEYALQIILLRWSS